MTNEQAKDILQMLLDGVDPITGEVLADDHVCNQPEVIRAFHTAITALTRDYNSSYPIRQNGKLNAGRPWTDADRAQLKKLFCAGASIESICYKLQRRKRGVEKQLDRLVRERPSHLDEQPPKARAPWSEEDEILLYDLYTLKWPINRMAARLQRSERAIYCRMKTLKLYGMEPGYPQKND